MNATVHISTEKYGVEIKIGGGHVFQYEEAICHYVGIEKPDFRKFNGGFHPKK